MAYDSYMSLSGMLSRGWTQGGRDRDLRATLNTTERGKPSQGRPFRLINMEDNCRCISYTLAIHASGYGSGLHAGGIFWMGEGSLASLELHARY